MTKYVKYHLVFVCCSLLMRSVVYLQGMLVNRKGMDERLSNGAAGQSFLARQRQAHTRRNQSMTSPHAAGSR